MHWFVIAAPKREEPSKTVISQAVFGGLGTKETVLFMLSHVKQKRSPRVGNFHKSGDQSLDLGGLQPLL